MNPITKPGEADLTAEREAFEAEVSRHIDPARSPETLARDEDGGYHEWGTALAWEAWQARAALGTGPATPVPEPRNAGHGHVFPRPDGLLAKCGGPRICQFCKGEASRL